MAIGSPEAGQLLVASPKLEESWFARTLILLLDVDDGGALGVVLNRPTAVEVGTVLDDWRGLVDAPGVFFNGGPVEPEGALGVARLAAGATAPEGWRQMFGRIGVVDLDRPEPGRYDAVRIYAGYAGWGSGQLQDEIAEGSWYVVPALPEDLSAGDPERLWLDVLRRQAEPLSLLATMPVDPTLN